MIVDGVPIYYPILQIPEGRAGSVGVEHYVVPAKTTIRTNTPRSAFFGQPVGSVVYPYPTTWHRLVEDERGVWMTDQPVEQRQHDALLRGFRGRVLVGGLGLGYAATVLASSRRVSRIVVVEKSPDVIALVWPHLSETVREKATIVERDLFAYLHDVTPKAFDFGFYDIWQGDGEMTFHEIVEPLRRLSAERVAKVRCWNEDVMRGQLYMGLLSRLALLTNPVAAAALEGAAPTIEQLCEPRRTGSCDYFWNWSVPFWRWYRDRRPANDFAERAASHYAENYGRPEKARLLALFSDGVVK